MAVIVRYSIFGFKVLPLCDNKFSLLTFYTAFLLGDYVSNIFVNILAKETLTAKTRKICNW